MMESSPLRVFISYSHRDDAFRHALENHLSLLQREGIIEGWSDRDIMASEDWNAEINENLEAADIILLLVSANFIASDYAWDKEMLRAIERHDAGQARVIPIVLKPVDFRTAPFARLQALPKDARPITKWSNRDEAWLDVIKGIRSVAVAVNERRQAPQEVSEQG